MPMRVRPERSARARRRRAQAPPTPGSGDVGSPSPEPRAQPRRGADREHVGEQVEEHVARGEEQHDRLHHRQVAALHAGGQRAAEARDTRRGTRSMTMPAGEVDHRSAEPWIDRHERVAQRVAADHAPLAHALQPRHLHVLGLEHVDHRGALQPGEVRHDREHERHHGQRQLGRVRERRCRRAGCSATAGSAWKTDGREQEQQAEPDHELGQRREHEQHDLRDVVERAVAAHRGERAEQRARAGSRCRPSRRRARAS